jgi:hypothetical protein
MYKQTDSSNITNYADLLSSIVPHNDDALSNSAYMRNHLKWLSPWTFHRFI